MTDRLTGAGAGAPMVIDLEQGARSSVRGTGRFAEALRSEEARAARAEPAAGDGAATAMLRDAARSITRGERVVDSAIRAARRGQVFSQEELLALQAGVYRYTQELELASKLVDKATGAVRQTLQSQQ